VTPKGKSQEHTFLSPFAMPFYILFLIVLFSIPMAGYKWFYSPLFRDVITVTFFWSCFNVTLALASLGSFWERRQVRGYHRAWACVDTKVFFPRMGETIGGVIRDVSLTGVGIDITTPFPIKSEEEIIIHTTDSFGEDFEFRARILRKVKAGGVEMEGCQFVLKDDDFPRLVRFVYGDSKRWNDLWEKKSVHGNPFRIFFHTFRMAFKGGKQSILALNQTLFMVLKKYTRAFYGVMKTLILGKEELQGE
jgi:cellulose synthase (UDP-forming)